MNKKEAKKLANELLKKRFPKDWKMVIEEREDSDAKEYYIYFKYNDDVIMYYDEETDEFTMYEGDKKDYIVYSKDPLFIIKNRFENHTLYLTGALAYNSKLKKALDSFDNSVIIHKGKYNACTDPCDTNDGPCACGAWHKKNKRK